MKRTRKICSICKKREIKSTNKTCGNSECKGKYAEYKTKKRIERQKAAEPYIRKWAELSKIHWGDRKVCVVCGDFLDASLAIHHFDKKKDPKDTVTLCGSCHRVFDSAKSGLRELKVRRKRYYNYNLKNATIA